MNHATILGVVRSITYPGNLPSYSSSVVGVNTVTHHYHIILEQVKSLAVGVSTLVNHVQIEWEKMWTSQWLSTVRSKSKTKSVTSVKNFKSECREAINWIQIILLPSSQDIPELSLI